jgi:cell division protein FtsB
MIATEILIPLCCAIIGIIEYTTNAVTKEVKTELKDEYDRMAKYTKHLERRMALLESKLDILLELDIESLGKSQVSI